MEWRRSLNDRSHTEWFHDTREEMYTQFWLWFDLSLREVQDQRAIQLLALANPSDPTSRLDVGLVDPTTVTVIVGYAQSRGYDAAAVYVGLIAQDPMCTWRGLTGFFVGWCQGCDQDGENTLQSLRQELRALNVELRSIWDLPPAIHPQGGWFEDERLRFGALVNGRAGVEDLWGRPTGSAKDGPALLATGLVVTGLANLVLVERLSHDMRRLATLRQSPSLWSIRSGRMDVLAELAAIPSKPVLPRRQEVRRRAELPATWGAYRESANGSWSGPVPNLRNALEGHVFGRNDDGASTMSIAFLPPDRAARLSDILQLPHGSP